MKSQCFGLSDTENTPKLQCLAECPIPVALAPAAQETNRIYSKPHRTERQFLLGHQLPAQRKFYNPNVKTSKTNGSALNACCWAPAPDSSQSVYFSCADVKRIHEQI